MLYTASSATARAAEDKDDDNSSIPPIVPFSEYYSNSRLVLAKDKLRLIILMLADLESAEQKEGSENLVTPDDYTIKTYPYSEFYNKKTSGWKSKLVASKKIMANELRCCNPLVKPNTKNNSVNCLMEKLAALQIEDKDELLFIHGQASTFQLILENQLNAEDEDQESGSNQMTENDCLWFIVILIENKTILQVYLSHTSGKDKDGVN